jgi:hypothetical protein
MTLPAIGEHERELMIVFSTFVVAYTAYYALFHSKRITARFREALPVVSAEVWRNLLYRFVLVIGFCIIPVVLLYAFTGRSLDDYGVRFDFDWAHAGVIAGLSAVLVGLIAVNPGRSKLTSFYPHMRIENWTPGHVVVNVLSWAAYLFAYELMFRGFILTTLMPFGVVAAVAVNIALYVAVHIPKGLSEAVGAIPFGLVVCYLTISYGTIWAAFFLHLALALSNSFVALVGNPEMRIRWITSPGR